MGPIRLKETRAVNSREAFTLLNKPKVIDRYTESLISDFEEGWLTQAQLMALCPQLFEQAGVDLSNSANVKFMSSDRAFALEE